ncbi:GerMN domain-containing protein [Leucobacter sp. HNU]|uniref:GerMN domain-containing protein n=1 Tax=Leucobacter sp. HNU TaxID=3236805 RepID=UPI003A7FF7F1
MTERIRGIGRVFGVAVIAAGALLLAACNAIPQSGPVNVGLSDLTKGDQLVSYSPPGPAKGASQKDVVIGFVNAAASSQDDYRVAREFLTPEYSSQWDPSTGAFVYEGARPYRSEDGDIGVLSLPGSATVDERGVLTPARPGATSDVRFELTKVDGQWRISSAPAGVILERGVFRSVWAPHDVAFLSPDDRLITETRWFLNGPGMATQVVKALLDGPAEEMRGAMRTAFPEGTGLVANSVTVLDGTAKIDLTGQAASADHSTRQLVFRQLAASLQSVQG